MPIKDRNGDQTFVKRTDDGMYAVVRTDTGKNTGRGFSDDVDHSHKETTSSYIVNPNTNQGRTDIDTTTRYNDIGEVSSIHRETHILMN